MTGEMIAFYILAAIAIASAGGMLLSRNAVYSAVFLILNFAVIAVFYLLLGAPFIAMVQVAVYAGAIMVLFMFVVMLLGAERLKGPRSASWGYFALASVLIVALVAVSIFVISQSASLALPQNTDLVTAEFGSPASVGTLLFSEYIFPFEVIALLLLVAMVGAVVLTQERKKKEDINAMQRDRRKTQEQSILEKQLQQYQQMAPNGSANGHATNGSEADDDAPETETTEPAQTSE